MRILEKIKRSAKQIKKEILVLSLAIKDERTPILAKLLIGITIGYALSPIDLIPDFIPVIGFIDDLIILPLLILLSLKFIPEEVLNDCRDSVNNEVTLNKKLGQFSAIMIVLIWFFLAGLILYKLVK
ncbi:YkvA family protein [Namhaeicola litoreus]|uniref:YkvA family protein n=1 Tax=Namhaeicola litoreus TaxID=1052145 RepID=A0ABW3XXK0_9FLAO